jgi:hypothetical protein
MESPQLDVGVECPTNYTVGNAVEDWLNRGLKGLDADTVDNYRRLAGGCGEGFAVDGRDEQRNGGCGAE